MGRQKMSPMERAMRFAEKVLIEEPEKEKAREKRSDAAERIRRGEFIRRNLDGTFPIRNEHGRFYCHVENGHGISCGQFSMDKKNVNDCPCWCHAPLPKVVRDASGVPLRDRMPRKNDGWVPVEAVKSWWEVRW